MEQVDEGFRGIKNEWGKVVGEPLPPGLYFYNPISSGITEINVRERKLEGTTECFTFDTQKVTVAFTVTLYPKPESINKIYSQIGTDWERIIVGQVILGSMKDAIGRYKADDLVGKREMVKKEAEKEIIDNLMTRDVILTKLDLTNLQFDGEYEKAVEAKVVAIQRAAEAKNKTVQIEEESKQTLLTAKANAEAMKIKSSALSQNQNLVQYEAVQRWNGVLPQYVIGGGTVPFIDLNKLGK